MASNMVVTYSDVLFDLYNRTSDPSKKGSQNGWPYCETEIGLRIFQEAAESEISRTSQPTIAPPAPPPPAEVTRQSRPFWPPVAWVVGAGAIVVIGWLVALAWQAHRQSVAKTRIERQEVENTRTWRDAAQQLSLDHVAELRILNSNQVAFAAGQAQIGALLTQLGTTDSKLAGLASAQADATRQLAAAQAALAQETTNLLESLRQTLRQGLAEAAKQSHADNVNLQAQVAELAAGQKALLDRLSQLPNSPNAGLALPGVKTKRIGNATQVTFDEGLFVQDACFRSDAKSRLLAVAKALAQGQTPQRIEVIGCADDVYVFNDWTTRLEEKLALNRATAVVNYFIELGLFAPKRLAAISGGVAERPFPSDTAQNRANNRTVVLMVWPADKPPKGHEEPGS